MGCKIEKNNFRYEDYFNSIVVTKDDSSKIFVSSVDCVRLMPIAELYSALSFLAKS